MTDFDPIAKQNVERRYVAVGILEEFPKFLEILENVLPQFFGNATHAKSTRVPVHVHVQCKDIHVDWDKSRVVIYKGFTKTFWVDDMT